MAKDKEKMLETFNKNFPALTEENKLSILAITKFLVRTQDTVIPSIFNKQEQKEDSNKE
ncbi:hypothetical protein LQZ19_02205 [Treponema primitia]|uniref:hypothetical protein n=1 Tax=Treponema primitia TaxID=88058 RepID=UPI0039812C23